MIYDSINHPVIGIDLGTTYTVISKWTGSSSETYGPLGQYLTPSVVLYDKENILVGKIAKDRAVIYPQKACSSIKRHMDSKKCEINLNNKFFSPVELSSYILNKVYCSVKDMYPKGVYKSLGAVITVPYYFRANQIINTIEAAKLANLDLLGVIQEPIAACLNYVLSNIKDVTNQKILVFDLGGGTFDLALIYIKNRQDKISFKVISTQGDDKLGGIDFDSCLFEYVVHREKINFENLPPKIKAITINKLKQQIILAKKKLSFDDVAYINVIDVPPGSFLECEVTKEEFLNCIYKYLKKIKVKLINLMKQNKIGKNNIDRVIKIGGASKMPILDEIISEIVGENKIYSDIDPDLSVSKGASIYGAYLSGILNIDKKLEFNIITSYDFGVKDEKGNFIPLIFKNSSLPCKSTLTFTNSIDYENEFNIQCYEGFANEGEFIRKIGDVNIRNLRKAKKEELDIDITFNINVDQTIDVIVQEKESSFYICKTF